MTTLLNKTLKLAALLILAFAAPQVYAQAPAIQSKAAAHSVIALKSNTTTSEKNYTLYEVQNFPIIEVPASLLVAMDDHEYFDYDLIFASARSKKKDDLKALNTGSSKHKIAPKLTT